MILWTIRVHSFSVYEKKKKTEKKWSQEPVCGGALGRRWGGGGGGAMALQLKKDDNWFLFSGFRVFRIYGWFFKTEHRTSSYFMNLVVDFYSFSGFKKISMSITWSYEIFNVLFVTKTKKDFEKFTKCYKGEPSKGISNTGFRFPSGGFAPPQPPIKALPWTHKGA